MLSAHTIVHDSPLTQIHVTCRAQPQPYVISTKFVSAVPVATRVLYLQRIAVKNFFTLGVRF